MKSWTYVICIASLCSIGTSYAQSDEDKYEDPKYSRSANFRAHSPDKDEGLFVVQPHFFTNLEFLYWTADVGSLYDAIKMKDPAWSTQLILPTGDIEHASYGLGSRITSCFWVF